MIKATAHITFFYDENRFKYLDKAIEYIKDHPYHTDIYIHTNQYFRHKVFPDLNIIVHELPENPFYLTWKCRPIIEKQKDNYDIFMYLEDDIGIPKKAIEYWLKYKDECLRSGMNLGFLRVERNTADGLFYVSDFKKKLEKTIRSGMNLGFLRVERNIADGLFYVSDFKKKLKKTITIDGMSYIINNINPYVAFWIYDKKEFNRFIQSKEWKFNFKGYSIRASSAIGWNSPKSKRYKHTVIPLINNSIIDDCKVYHLPNNYIGHRKFCKYTIEQIIK